MSIFQVLLLAVVQGLAELLPVSSSAHVIVAEKLMGLDPSTPPMTFLLVMLHTGTMLAVIKYFWPKWKKLLLSPERASFLRALLIATVLTGIVGFGLKGVLEHVILAQPGEGPGEVRELFKSLPLIALALFCAGVVILVAGLRSLKRPPAVATLSTRASLWIGAIQGLCLPFRGFSRSGATISTGLLLGVKRELAEDFSFALAVILTPPAILIEIRHLLKAATVGGAEPLSVQSMFLPGLLGMVFSFLAGLVALRWLSSWLEKGRWHYFGVYCLVASAVIYGLSHAGF
jgi:undecaprenyl-diphosphatase